MRPSPVLAHARPPSPKKEGGGGTLHDSGARPWSGCAPIHFVSR
ncbi:MAG: hypothetical protein AVDCRST_MAG89-5048 [uncultured Gemmatimonadetes bacterium]|uniref:Uncharacterized protein n=1 Tax=uncultured Gemmatimonadota bacterium TaxID=203437 RepID=A0A6J4N3Q3_9BACT|nr:MAG: hypothetical protein AVDCRST_MAG89-5048 [uncultured Gemmatimonadota bacterium]